MSPSQRTYKSFRIEQFSVRCLTYVTLRSDINMNSRDRYSNELSKLMAFGPGGAFVADALKAQPPPVNGLPVGGVADAVDWFLGGLRDGASNRILFRRCARKR